MSFPVDEANKLRQEYGLTCFVESGTANGRTTKQCAEWFQKLWTIEVSPHAYVRARHTLKDCENVTTMLAQSVHAIPLILPQLTGPTLWWLDGHWSGSGPRYAVECPLLRELQEIGGLRESDVILIDDARLLMNPPGDNHRPEEWPTWMDMQDMLEDWPEEPAMRLLGNDTPDDVIVLTKP